ncbi:LytR C-terminal domain-containing protein [Nocardioides massiliensis]|uniref:LytR/CpsA/Psr regulator C-terminal domain-containing protein n=1 Tax=Nocardioides massiliensis TaxID=1325935 RepID=A0ABT9NPW0_9ACTN|nr:LytR C-terminal domain-containing protein [Nocardioides massiliensis]MDP9822105.1 hypothetical protein [Nocardioides massiliensis]
MARRARERGVAAPAFVAVLSTVVVIAAGVFFVSTGGAAEEPTPAAPTPTVVATATPTPTPTAEATPTKRRPRVQRGQVYVEVYNNSGISGLAARTSATVKGAGWQVVGEDNWYGTITESTVYFPPRLRAAGRLLARDLGINRVRPAVDPMKLDRLTVILTADFA